MKLFTAFCTAGMFLVTALWASQADSNRIDKSLVPLSSDHIEAFVPKGWKIDEQLQADLNGDSRPDYVLKLIADRPAKSSDGIPVERARALVVVFENENGTLSRAAVADKLLQCTTCGGTLYAAVDAPANIKVQNGVIVLQQDHGSREVTGTTYRFRYNSMSRKFVIIGFDFDSGDRLTLETVSESTNYLTGLRIVKRTGDQETTTRTQVPKISLSIEDVDSDKFEEEAVKRLNL